MRETYSYKRDWDEAYRNHEGFPWEVTEIDPILQRFFIRDNGELQFKKEAKILDVGCGRGNLCEYLSNLGYEDVSGIDVSQYVIQECREAWKESKVNYKAMDVFDVKETYDVVVCWFILHHVVSEDVDRFIIKLNKICKSGGSLIIAFLLPNKEKTRDSYYSSHKVHLYSAYKVRQMLNPYYRGLTIDRKKSGVLKNEDEHKNEFHFQAFIGVKKNADEIILDKIKWFKKKHIINISKDFNADKSMKDLIDLLNVFSNCSQNVVDLKTESFSNLYSSLFRNVSRYFCKRYNEENDTADAVILKLDTHSGVNGGSLYSVSKNVKLDNEKLPRPHCRFNGETNSVQSRAYDLFNLYNTFLKDENDADDYSIHKHFVDNPDSNYIAFSKAVQKYDEGDFTCPSVSFKEFISLIFEDSNNQNSNSFFSFYSDKKSNVDKENAASFTCINLGIVGFECWGTLMIESLKNYEAVLGKFFELKKYKIKCKVISERKLLQDIKNVVFILKKIDYAYYDALSNRQIKLEAIKSAIAALMSRNMSHNLGSHYLTNTKNYFGRRANSGLMESNVVSDNERKLLLSDYRGNAHLLQYIQERMDFIATILSTDHYPLGPLNFKAEFFDVLTNDDCGERHGKQEKNFLLQYLLFSEKYTRREHFGDIDDPQFGNVRLVVKYGDEIYTGLNKKKGEENGLKMSLSKLRLAVPGGIMSRQALFTIVENILRNSAKHNKRKQGEELVLTIDVVLSNGECKILFYDNSYANHNGELLATVRKKYQEIKIIDVSENNQMDKQDKGLKEMLVCALWLKNKDVAKTLLDIQEGNDSAFNYLNVLDKDGNLCYEITLDAFETIHNVENDLENKDGKRVLPVEKMLQIHADFVVAKRNYAISIDSPQGTIKKKLSELFPRFKEIKDIAKLGEEEIKSSILNGSTYKGYRILVDYASTPASIPKGVENIHVNSGRRLSKKTIVFLDHYFNNGGLDAAKEMVEQNEKALYVDSISGENFTSTIVSPDFYSDPFARLKVIDSARDKIAILDERIWADYRSRWVSYEISEEKLLSAWRVCKDASPVEYLSRLADHKDAKEYLLKEIKKYNTENKKSYLDLDNVQKKELVERLLTVHEKQRANTQRLLEKKNIFIYTMQKDALGNWRFANIKGNEFQGSSFRCKFLTVHLGLIEKSGNPKDFMDKIKRVFNPKYICIHSGRGNFSPELEKELSSYPFISLSALDAALENSKYLLSELLNNINYYGKGNINHK